MIMRRREVLGGIGALAGSLSLVASAAQAAAPGPTPAQQRWLKLGYGMFIHFGPNTLAGVGWGDGKFPAADFKVRNLDPAQWASIARDAGMRYAVLTAKHHDGFCLWRTETTAYGVASAPGGRDVVGEFVKAFRAAGLEVGLYYSLWDRNCPFYEDDARYANYMRQQIGELTTRYGPLVELWFDGGWDKDHPSREWDYRPEWDKDPSIRVGKGERWEWQALYDSIHARQPDCLVIQNSSSDRPGVVKYHPVDARTAELFDFVWKGEIKRPKLDPIWTRPDGKNVYLPLEYCATLTPSWFNTGAPELLHPSVATINDWRRRAKAGGGNLLLNIGPARDGRMPEAHRTFLVEARRQMPA